MVKQANNTQSCTASVKFHVFLMTRRVLPQKEDATKRRAVAKKGLPNVKTKSIRGREIERQVEDIRGRRRPD